MKVKFIPVIAAALGVVGCGPTPAVITTPTRPTQVERVTDRATMGTENQIVVQGRNRGSVRLLAVKEDRPNGFMRLNIGFQNVSKSDESVQFQVQYFDKDGLPIAENSGWLPLEIPEQGARYASVTSVRKDAATFKVHMLYR
jgi:hypothetical protein